MKIYFISYGTGGAEIINSVFPHVLENNKEKDVRNIVISEYARNKNKNSIFINEKSIIDYLKSDKPDIIINERSNGLKIQNRITEYCKDNSILNICILDTYGGYDARFTALPDKVLVPSKSTFNDLLNFGFSEKDLYLSGNASFERLNSYNYNKRIDRISPKVLFTSQVFDQFYIFADFYNELNEAFNQFEIHVKTHPQEDIRNWNSIINYFKNAKMLDFDNKNDFLKECLKYDLIIGYSSTLQIQSQIIGIPTIFYELGDIHKEIHNFKEGKELKSHPYSDFEPNALYRTIKILQELIST